MGLFASFLSQISTAHADPDPNQPAAGTGTCTGMVNTATIAGTTTLAVGSGDQQMLLQQNANNAFGRAECECRSRDLSLRIQLSTPLPPGTTIGAVSPRLYVGQADCKDLSKRGQPGYPCEPITNDGPPGYSADFNSIAQSFKSVGPFSIPIPAESLTNPKPVGATDWPWSCNIGAIPSNTISLLVGADPTPAVCSLNLSVNTTPPTAPSNLSLSAGDSALTVNWSIPQGTSGIEYFQILCRKQNDSNPVMSDDFVKSTKYWFSSCVNGTLYRRPLSVTMTDNTVVPPPPGVTMPPPPDMGTGTADGGTADGGTADGGTGTSGSTFPIDGRFICSDRISSTETAPSRRISNLQNGQAYEVMVVSIDAYGNPAASSVKVGVPQPTLSPLQPFCDQNGGICPTGFGCQAAATPVGVGTVSFLAFSALFLLVRRRRARFFTAGPRRRI